MTVLPKKSIGTTEVEAAGADLVTALFDQYHVAIYNYLRHLVEDDAWAHDLTQEAFLQLWRTRARLPAVQNRRAWLYRVATNIAYNGLKRRRRFQWLPWRPALEREAAQPAPESGLAARDAVERALAALTPTYRLPLLLYSQYGLSVREVAVALEISEANVKVRLHRAREQFQTAYEQESGAGRSRDNG